MYAKYHTHGFVVRREYSGENDASITIYTADFGLVRARARALREERSRMRYALQECAEARLSLVRGARGWRMAGALAESEALRGEALRAFARMLALVERLAGEEPNDALFEVLSHARERLITRADMWAPIELVSVARILQALGYLSEEALGRALSLDEDAMSDAETDRDAYLRLINQALAGTHL